jgi:hypothetical protein
MIFHGFIKKDTVTTMSIMQMVGMTGFEPAAFCSQSRRDTKLRYIPKCLILARLT